MAKTSLHTHTAVARLPGVSYRLSCNTSVTMTPKRRKQSVEGFLELRGVEYRSLPNVCTIPNIGTTVQVVIQRLEL